MAHLPDNPNIYEPLYDEPREELDGFTAHRARIGHQLGTERVGLSMWLLPAGQTAYPYHFHLAEEEVLIVIEGNLALRTPDGWQRIRRDDVVRFPTGPDGAHQLHNDGDVPAQVLAVSTHGQPDVVVYPDENKLNAAERTPRGDGMKVYFKMDDAVPYWTGIAKPEVGHVDPA